jgi:hypothetical protein
MISWSVPQMPSASVRTSTAPSLTGGGGTSSSWIELASPGWTVKARMKSKFLKSVAAP